MSILTASQFSTESLSSATNLGEEMFVWEDGFLRRLVLI
jgi:hypothetical protein